MNIEIIKITTKESQSKREVLRKLGMSIGGSQSRKLDKIYKENNIDISHFKKRTPVIKKEKKCPVCGDSFTTQIKVGKKEQVTCSHSCSNTYFRSGVNNPNWNEDTYQSTCFLYHKKECVICKENKVLDVHHYDGDKKNNSPKNLIPLCPTHHRYWHSQYRYLIIKQIDEYIKKYQKHNKMEN